MTSVIFILPHSTSEGEMQPSSSVLPVLVALIIAVVGTAVLLNMDFGPRNAVRNDGINKISRAALARAGATATPTQASE
jgi:hypothetical protein